AVFLALRGRPTGRPEVGSAGIHRPAGKGGVTRRICANFAGLKGREGRDRIDLSTNPYPEPPMALSVDELQPVLHDLFGKTADELARATGFCQRARKLTGSVFAQSLVAALLENPQASLEDFAEAAEAILEVSVTAQAFDQRFTPEATDFLYDLLLAAF